MLNESKFVNLPWLFSAERSLSMNLYVSSLLVSITLLWIIIAVSNALLSPLLGGLGTDHVST